MVCAPTLAICLFPRRYRCELHKEVGKELLRKCNFIARCFNLRIPPLLIALDCVRVFMYELERPRFVDGARNPIRVRSDTLLDISCPPDPACSDPHSPARLNVLRESPDPRKVVGRHERSPDFILRAEPIPRMHGRLSCNLLLRFSHRRIRSLLSS